MAETPTDEQTIDERPPRRRLWHVVAAVAAGQLSTPAPARHGTAGPRALRHISPRRSALAAAAAALLIALTAPLLLLTLLAPGNPQRLATDPAVAALLEYAAGLDGTPTRQAAARSAAATVHVTTLSDGTTKVWRTGRAGQCYYLLIPASTDAPTSGVRAGTPADCATP